MIKFLFVILFPLVCMCHDKDGSLWDLIPFSEEEILANFELLQLQEESSCIKEVPFDPKVVVEGSRCMKGVISAEFINRTSVLLTDRQFQQLGAEVCEILPKLNVCGEKVVSFIEACRDIIGIQLTRKWDGFIRNYLCSTPKNQEYLGLFLYHWKDFIDAGGYSCLGFDEDYRKLNFGMDIKGILMARFADESWNVGMCMAPLTGSVLPDFEKSDTNSVCKTIQAVQTCGKTLFGYCDSLKPWESVTRGLDSFEDKLSCNEKPRIHSEL